MQSSNRPSCLPWKEDVRDSSVEALSELAINGQIESHFAMAKREAHRRLALACRKCLRQIEHIHSFDPRNSSDEDGGPHAVAVGAP